MSKSMKWVLQPATSSVSERSRRFLSRFLRVASATVARLARQLGQSARSATQEPVLFEFHAEAGAPEGALFVNGQRIGTLPGVTRL